MHNGNVTGVVRVDAEIYNIRHIGSGIHLVVHVDQSGFPPDHPRYDSNGSLNTNFENRWVDEFPSSQKIEKSLVGGNETVTVLVAYTAAAATAYGGDMTVFVTIMIDEANDSFDNSNIALRFQRRGSPYDVDYTETNDLADIDRLVNPADGFMDDLHYVRADVRADMVSHWGPHRPCC